MFLPRFIGVFSRFWKRVTVSVYGKGEERAFTIYGVTSSADYLR